MCVHLLKTELSLCHVCALCVCHSTCDEPKQIYIYIVYRMCFRNRYMSRYAFMNNASPPHENDVRHRRRAGVSFGISLCIYKGTAFQRYSLSCPAPLSPVFNVSYSNEQSFRYPVRIRSLVIFFSPQTNFSNAKTEGLPPMATTMNPSREEKNMKQERGGNEIFFLVANDRSKIYGYAMQTVIGLKL